MTIQYRNFGLEYGDYETRERRENESVTDRYQKGKNGLIIGGCFAIYKRNTAKGLLKTDNQKGLVADFSAILKSNAALCR